jgi:hypothetical protein
MPKKQNLPAIKLQVTELVLSGSTKHAEEAINETAEKFGDLAVVEVLESLEPQVASLHLSAFDGGKLSLATLLIPPKAWAESLAYFAATWDADWIEDEPEVLAESLFAHIHGIIFSSDDEERRAELIHEALSTDWGTTAFAVLFSTATEDIIEIANDIHNKGSHSSGHTTSDHDVIPLALEIARTDVDAWDRVLFEIFPDWQPGENQLQVRSDDAENHDDTGDEDENNDHEFAMGRTTKELLLRLRNQVPTKAISTPKVGRRPSLGEDIFS